jgi:hypothetical protein
MYLPETVLSAVFKLSACYAPIPESVLSAVFKLSACYAPIPESVLSAVGLILLFQPAEVGWVL